MSERADFKGGLDHIKLQKFKKTQGYDSKLDKLFQKAKKAKPNKENIQVKSAVGAMKFRSFGKKPSPVNSIDYEKIKKIIESTPSERVVAFAYPGPDEKSPIMLHAMRFKGEKDYTYFVERMAGRVRSASGSNSRSPPRSDRQSMTEPLNGKNTPPEPIQQQTNRTPSRGTVPSVLYSTSPPRSSSISSSSDYGRKRPSSHSQKAARGAESFISTDGLLPPGRMRGRRRSPVLKIKSPYETSYICARWRIRESPSSRRRPASAQPRRPHSPKSTRRPVKVGTLYQMPGSSSSESSYSSSDASYSGCCGESISSSDYTPVRSKSHKRIYYASGSESGSGSGSSSDSASTDSLQLFGKSLPNSRSYVISRCTGDHRSALKCRPVGGFTVTSETPSFMYEA